MSNNIRFLLLQMQRMGRHGFYEKGMRLGYGGGFYDRYLKQKENLHRTGIAFGEQIVKRIPTEIHDHPMDDVITEQQWYRPKRTTGGE